MIRQPYFTIAIAGVFLFAFQGVDHGVYAGIYDTPKTPIQLRARKLADGMDAASAGLAAADIDGDGKPEIVAWSDHGVKVFRDGSASPVACGLDGLRDVISLSAGDLNGDGLADLAILTKADAELWINRGGRFEKLNAFIPEGAYNKAVWIDYDHDNDLDLFLLGDKSALLRNDGAAGFRNVSNNFPFIAGRAVDGTLFDLTPDANGMDLVVTYSDRPGVLYEDKLGGRYEARELNQIPAGAKSVMAMDLDNDGATDLIVANGSGAFPLFNRRGSFEMGAKIPVPSRALAPIDVENRGLEDLAVSGTVFRNEGLGRFSGIKASAVNSSALLAVDFDGDGRTDLISVQPDGSLSLLRNETATPNGWLRVSLQGGKTPVYGSKIELKAGSLYQKRTFTGDPLVFGMGGYKEADTVRIVWPDGVVQNEIHQPAGRSFVYKPAPVQ